MDNTGQTPITMCYIWGLTPDVTDDVGGVAR